MVDTSCLGGQLSASSPLPNILPNGLKVSHSTLSQKFAALQRNHTGRCPGPESKTIGIIINLGNLELM